jgi:hypothetical protein
MSEAFAATLAEEEAAPAASAPERPPENRADLTPWAERQIVRTSCAHCSARFEGAAPVAREWFAEHRRTAHPELGEVPERGRKHRASSAGSASRRPAA